MKHEMKFNKESFEEVKNGNKKIEIRLFDKKRQKVNIGDTIEFSKLPKLNEKLIVEVKGIKRYPAYKILVANTPLTNFGNKWKSKEQILEKGCTIYSKEEQNKYGFVVFEIKLLDKQTF
jgi:ASC-1-like (ASCH) protein